MDLHTTKQLAHTEKNTLYINCSLISAHRHSLSHVTRDTAHARGSTVLTQSKVQLQAPQGRTGYHTNAQAQATTSTTLAPWRRARAGFDRENLGGPVPNPLIEIGRVECLRPTQSCGWARRRVLVECVLRRCVRCGRRLGGTGRGCGVDGGRGAGTRWQRWLLEGGEQLWAHAVRQRAHCGVDRASDGAKEG